MTKAYQPVMTAHLHYNHNDTRFLRNVLPHDFTSSVLCGKYYETGFRKKENLHLYLIPDDAPHAKKLKPSRGRKNILSLYSVFFVNTVWNLR